MEVTCFSETPFDFQRATQHYLPEDITILICICNLIFVITMFPTFCVCENEMTINGSNCLYY
jgi:hypothetical protein